MSLLSKFVKETHTFFIAGGVMSLGDYVAQKVVEKKPELDVARNVRFAAVGLFWAVSIMRSLPPAATRGMLCRAWAAPVFVGQES